MNAIATPRQSAASFHTTRWTRVCAAKSDSDDGRRALADLCDAYYEPVIAFLRMELRDVDMARDAAHGFFSELLGGASIDGALPERGRFRSYLLGCVKNHLSRCRDAERRQKRGGGTEKLPLDDAAALAVSDESALSADEEFDRQWALTAIAHASQRLRREWELDGKGALFEALHPWLSGDAGRGDQAALGASLGMSENTLKSHVSRLRKQFRDLLKAEITGTLLEDSVEDEMQALYAALRKK